MKKKLLFLISVLLLGIGIVGFLSYQSFYTASEKVTWEVNSDIKLSSKQWEKLLEEEEPEHAYSIIKKEYEGVDPGVAHSAFHYLGEILYNKIGLEAIGVCDDSYGFACYHGLYITAIADKGESAIVELNNYCLKTAYDGLDCPHGIGHGIIEYVSHKNVNEALLLCESLESSGSKFGCASGVLMEYNFPAVDAGNGLKSLIVRKLTDNNVHELCDNSPKGSHKVCYFSVPQWWMRVFNDYVKVGQLCSEIEDDENRKTCFVGIGNQVNYKDAKYDTGKTMQFCDDMPTVKGRDFCLLGALWTAPSAPNKTEYFNALCGSIDKESYCSFVFRDFMNGNLPD